MVSNKNIKQYYVYRQQTDTKGKLPFLNNPDYDLAKSIHGFTVRDLNHQPVKLDKYSGKVCIIVNVASRTSGYSYYNYKMFNQLYEKYAQYGLRILAFPCNQFNNQAPATNEDLKKLIHDLHIKYDVFASINVNCNDAHPLWKYLKISSSPVGKKNHKYRVITDPFTKFIVGRNGVPYMRLQPGTNEDEVLAALEPLLQNSTIKLKEASKGGKVKLPPPPLQSEMPPYMRPWHFTPGHLELI
ncbi:hypothetical protein O0L34_g14984 [Tuta absoluta]|nr:hypothetical protein O0L34_g14984 [Tuta absoluta]